MAEYAIPLNLILAPGISFDEVSFVFPPHNLIRVRRLRESWNDTHYIVTGEALLGSDTGLDLKIFELLFGHGSGGDTVLRFELAAARMSIASLIVAKGEELFGVDESVLESEDVKFRAFWLADGPCPSFRLSIHDIAARVRLPERFLKGELVENEEHQVVGIEPLNPPQRVDFTLVSASLYIDTERGFSFEFDPSQSITIPPFVIGDSGVGIQIDKLKVDFSGETGIPEVLSRPTYDESWKGVYLEKARLFGLDGWIPFFPEKVELSNWLLDGDGITGTVMLDPTGGVGVLGPFELDSVILELERNKFVRGVFETTFRWGALNDDWADWNNLLMTFTLRHNAGVGPGTVGFDISIRSVAEDPDALLTLTRAMIAPIEVGFAAAIIVAMGLDSGSETSIDKALVMTLLLIAASLQAGGALTIEEIKFVKATARYFTEEIDGELERFVDVAADFRGRISLDIPLGPVLGSILPHLKTDRPIGFEVRGFTLRFHGLDTPEVVFDAKSGISFDVGEQTLIEGSPFLITKAGIGKWERGVWLDLGLGYAKDTNKLAVTIDAIRLWFLDDGSLDHISFQGLSFSLLIPPSVYVKGKLEWGENVRLGTGRAYLCRKSQQNHEDRANWLWDLELALREETQGDVTSVVGSLEVTNSDGWPWGSMALYGISGLLGVNSRPAVLDPAQPDYVQWYREQLPANRIIATKWALEEGSEAAAFGVVIGSADGGRAWSAKAAIIYSSGVIIIPGSLNILSDRPKLSDDGHAALDMVLVADWAHDIYAVSIRFDYKKPDDGKLLHIHVPIDLYWRKSPKTWHAWVGQHMPVAARVGAKFLAREASFYFMIDRESIPSLGGTIITVPGTAYVLGGSVGFDSQFGKGRVKAFLRAGLEVHLAFGEVPNSGGASDDEDRTFFGGSLRLFGGIGLKVFGMGFEFVVDASVILMTPEPKYFALSLLFKIGLPWPIPDIKFTVNWTKGADGPLREPGHLCAGLSLHPRSRNAPIELKEDQLQLDVPIDPALTLTFAYPVRNSMTSVGSFNFDSVDTTVDWPMSEDKGYAVELENLTLFVEGPGGSLLPVPGPFPAIWLDAGDPAPGGKPSRKILQLFAYDGVMASRYIGATADYVQGMFEDFNPCSTKPPKPVCYQYAELALGPLTAPTSVGAPPDERRLAIGVIPELPGAETVRRYASLEATGTSVEDMSFLPARVIMLPATHGRNLPGEKAEPLASERLELAWQRARNAELSVLRIERDTRVAVRFFDGDQLVLEDVEGIVVGSVLGKLQDVRYRCDVPTTRAEVFAFQHMGEQSFGDPVSQTALYRVCVVYEGDMREWEDGEATAVAWSNLWSDLFNSSAATSDALLLEPGRRYKLEAKLRWLQVDGTNETPGGTQTHSFRFQTVAADQPPLERLRPADQMVDRTSWDIDTTPGNGAAAHYRDRGITMRMRDPRLDALYKAFGRRLTLRVVDDRGEDLFDRLAFLAEHAAEMPEYQEVFQEIVLGTSCANGDHTSLWSIGVAHFGSLLQLDRGYEGLLVSVPDPDGTVDLSTVDFETLPVLHSFRFRTSRWSNLTDHLAAHTLLDEILGGAPNLGGINASPPQLWDDVALEEALHARLGAVPRVPAPAPEIVRLWRPQGAGLTQAVVGVLIDGPEPLIRPTATITMTDASPATVPIVIRAARTATRALILFPSGGGLGPAPVGTLTLTINDGVESATAEIEIGVAPAFMAEEMAP
jgi:hypothetical protein